MRFNVYLSRSINTLTYLSGHRRTLVEECRADVRGRVRDTTAKSDYFRKTAMSLRTCELERNGGIRGLGGRMLYMYVLTNKRTNSGVINQLIDVDDS